MFLVISISEKHTVVAHRVKIDDGLIMQLVNATEGQSPEDMVTELAMCCDF